MPHCRKDGKAMSDILAKDRVLEPATMSSVYAKTLLSLMKLYPKVIEFEADLGRSLLGPDVLQRMRTEFPKQFVDCGIQECNMVGVAAGMSLAGWVPYVHSFAAFASRRVIDQVFLSGCYSKANIRIIGSDPGVTSAFNGGTHMPFEDIAAYRAFPEMTILEPTDSVMLESILMSLADVYGMFYLRLLRKNAVKIYEEGTSFQIGEAKLLKEGSDVTIIAAGVEVAEALTAAEMLDKEGIRARVLDMFTIKPLDQKAVISAAKETGAIVTAENHNVINGLGSAVADVLALHEPAPLEKIGIQDQFGEVGPMDYLKKRYGMTAEDIVLAAKRAICRKRSDR